MRRSDFSLIVLFLIPFFSATDAVAEFFEVGHEIELSDAELTTLKLIMNREATLRDMTKAVKGFEALNTALSQAGGPAKIIMNWNKGYIEAWKSANSAMEKIAAQVTCNEINTEIVTAVPGSPNEIFWKNLASTAGCT